MAILVTFTWPIGKFPVHICSYHQYYSTADSPGITTTIDGFLHSPPYLFDTIEASSMRFAGVIGALCGMCFNLLSPLLPLFSRHSGWVVGHFFNNWIFKRHNSTWRTELRLHGVWFPIGSMACGLITYGLTMHFGKHWIGLAFGWIMVNIGMVATIV